MENSFTKTEAALLYLFLFHILFPETISHSVKRINTIIVASPASLRWGGGPTENKPLFPANWI